MFGKNFKYVLVLGFLATFTYTNPAVLNSISSGIAYNSQQAAVWDAFFMHANTTPVSSTTFREAQHPSYDYMQSAKFGSTTMPKQSFASTTRPVGDDYGLNNKEGHRILPQDVVTALFKAGLISQDNLTQARIVIRDLEISTSTGSSSSQ